MAYLLDQIAAGGGGSSQDMQVAWTPTNAKLGQDIGFFAFGDIPETTLTFNATTSLSGYDIESTSTPTTMSWPNLVSIDPSNTNGGFLTLFGNTGITTVSFPLLATVSTGILFSGNSALTSINLNSLVSTGATSIAIKNNASLVSLSLPSLVPTNGNTYTFQNNALNAASVNGLLHRFVLNAGYVSGNIQLEGGTNAAPSGQGAADVITLTGRGVVVTSN